jgi:hypothetical protein
MEGSSWRTDPAALIARIGVSGLTVLRLPLVQRLEGLVGHIDLTAHFQNGWRLAMQSQRNVINGRRLAVMSSPSLPSPRVAA